MTVVPCPGTFSIKIPPLIPVGDAVLTTPGLVLADSYWANELMLKEAPMSFNVPQFTC